MITLSRVIPAFTPAMASISLGMVQAASARDVPAAFARLRKEIGAQRAVVRAVRQHLGSPAARLRDEPWEQLDELVDDLLIAERRIAHLRVRSRDVGRQVEAWVREHGTGHPSLLRRAAHETDQVFLEFLSLLRDMRWDVMTVRAEREPRSDEPIVSTAADLRALFDALPPSQDAA